jgi:hypothetical protein
MTPGESTESGVTNPKHEFLAATRAQSTNVKADFQLKLRRFQSLRAKGSTNAKKKTECRDIKDAAVSPKCGLLAATKRQSTDVKTEFQTTLWKYQPPLAKEIWLQREMSAICESDISAIECTVSDHVSSDKVNTEYFTSGDKENTECLACTMLKNRNSIQTKQRCTSCTLTKFEIFSSDANFDMDTKNSSYDLASKSESKANVGKVKVDSKDQSCLSAKSLCPPAESPRTTKTATESTKATKIASSNVKNKMMPQNPVRFTFPPVVTLDHLIAEWPTFRRVGEQFLEGPNSLRDLSFSERFHRERYFLLKPLGLWLDHSGEENLRMMLGHWDLKQCLEWAICVGPPS